MSHCVTLIVYKSLKKANCNFLNRFSIFFFLFFFFKKKMSLGNKKYSINLKDNFKTEWMKTPLILFLLFRLLQHAISHINYFKTKQTATISSHCSFHKS